MSLPVEKYGPWAIVTGASSGIGLEFVEQLAAAGLHVILVARNKEQLDAVADGVEARFAIQTERVAVDLGRDDALASVQKAAEGRDVGLLVVNAAMILAGSFLKTDLSDETQVLRVNIDAATRLTHVFAPQMAGRGRGGIVFVAGMGGFSSMPYMASYMASKAYLIAFGEALHDELLGAGVDVCVVCPGVTDTGAMSRTKGLRLSERSSHKGMATGPVVSQTLASLTKRRSLVIPGRVNRLAAFVLFRLLPRSTARRVLTRMVEGSIARDYR